MGRDKVEVTVDRNRLSSSETFHVRSVFQAGGGCFAGWQVSGDRIRMQLDIGCYYCPIPFPVFDFDLTSEPIGPLPAGEYVLEVANRLNDPVEVIHREKITVLVFTAASTDVGYVLRVADLLEGEVKQYRHPPGTPAPALADVLAFSCD